jgi:ketosteroid isomerase-like protein
VGDYGRAIATKDLVLFRRVKPNLSGDEEQRLRQAFEVGDQEVAIEITAVEVTGDTAHVRLVRSDTIGGKAIKPFAQVLALRRGPQGWRVESIGR